MPAGSILTVNAGSTSLKLRLVDAAGASEEIAALEDVPADVAAVGHRIVHGGPGLTAAARLDDRSGAALRDAAALAPLHDRPAIDAIAAARRALPDVPHVLVPDTAFHATLPPEASTYAVPARWREQWGVRRYGFHGLSVQWASERAAAMLGRHDLRLVVCHLGGGASVTAVRGGRSVDTTMGFGPLEGLVMATRSGTVDPDVPLHLVLRLGVPAAEVERALNEDSGLRALAGSGDMRQVEASAAGGDERAALALAVHDHRLAASVAAMAAALGGIDALAFTGGVGEGSARTRGEAARRLAFLGVAVDPDADGGAGDREVSAEGARVRTLVVGSREDLVIARSVRAVLGEHDGED
ncbi:MAG: acetate/propionate family kinase [Thermoleophilia bacterium]